jgi:hypothetical protein
MRKIITLTLIAMLCTAVAGAQVAKDADHLRPTGKGWAESDDNAPKEAKPAGGKPSNNGISYHGGPIMPGTVNIYYIWYGNWASGAKPSDSAATQGLLNNFIGGLNGSGYEKINSTYKDSSHTVTGNMVLAGSTTDNYSGGTALSDSGIQTVVSSAISSGRLPKDANGLYFVLTSSDVNETSGFCTRYCGWHTHATISGSDLKYSFVGNPDRCPSACEAETNSPNNDSGADGMASIIAHESEEAISDPDLNAWYDTRGAENADKCAWKFGPTQTTSSGAQYNQTLGGDKWLIQMNWENARGGGCDQTLGGTFYTF